MDQHFQSQTNLKDKGIRLSSNGSIKRSSTRSRHRHIVEVGHQLQAVSAFAWVKSYQYIWWGNKPSQWQFRIYYVHYYYHRHNHIIITHFTFLTSSWFLSCQIFSFVDRSFFCPSDCIHVLTWECVYRLLLINVESSCYHSLQ